MNTFLVSCKACGDPVDTGIVDVAPTGRRDLAPRARAVSKWVPALDVERACDRCGHRARYSLKQSVLVAAVQ